MVLEVWSRKWLPTVNRTLLLSNAIGGGKKGRSVLLLFRFFLIDPDICPKSAWETSILGIYDFEKWILLKKKYFKN